MVTKREAAQQQIHEQANRVWPLKGSIVAFASIVYIFLIIM